MNLKHNPINVLVTDGNNRASLAVTRSLGKIGFNIYIAGKKKNSISGYSRFCKKRLVYSDPDKYEKDFRKDIIGIVHKYKINILMPTAEMTTRECMKLKEELRNLCVIPFQDYESVSVAASKYEVLKLAEKLNIPIPATYYLRSPEKLKCAIEFCGEIGYPVVIKPTISRVKLSDGITNIGTQYAYCKNDLKGIVGEFNKIFYPLLIQERIHGDGVGIFTCFNHGEAIAFFSHRRLREKPPSGGVSVLRESYPVNEQIRYYSEKLLKSLNWHGVAMVEFKKDNRSNDYKLMEINGRFWGSLQLAIDAGVDFPKILANIALEQPNEPVKKFNYNTRTRWLWGDIDALIARIIKPDSKLNLPQNFPSKKDYLREFLKIKKSELNFEVLKLKDPIPWLIETMQWLKII